MESQPIALLMPLWAFDRPWLKVTCRCGRSRDIPLNRTLRGTRDERQLGFFIERLRCSACGSPPVRITLDDTGNAFATKGIGGRRIWLVRQTPGEP